MEEKNKIEEEGIIIKRNLTESDQYDLSIKVIILGDSYVGKSSLINRLIYNNYKDLPSTVAIEYHTYIISINQYKIRMQIWDTAGQERYNSLVSNYYKGTEVAIFLYSIDNEDSFKNIKFWFKNLKENSNNTLNILIGNKKDIDFDNNDNNNTGEKKERMILYEKAEKFAEENNFSIFRKISCKSKEKKKIKNIYEIFDEIGKFFYEKYKEKMNTSGSVNYQVTESMMNLGKKHRIQIEKEKEKNKEKCC